MQSKERRKIILASLPLLDSGGPVMVRIPPEKWEEEKRRSKARSKARELRNPTRNQHWYGPAFDGRQDLIHLVKLGLVKRERQGVDRSKRTYFVLVEKPVDRLALWREVAEGFDAFLDSMPLGWLAHTVADIGLLNRTFLKLGKARDADKKEEAK